MNSLFIKVSQFQTLIPLFKYEMATLLALALSIITQQTLQSLVISSNSF